MKIKYYLNNTTIIIVVALCVLLLNSISANAIYQNHFVDDFSDASINSSFWDTDTSGSGTVNEASGRVYFNLTANNDAAIMFTNDYYKDYNVSGIMQFNGIVSGAMGVFVIGRNQTATTSTISQFAYKVKLGIDADLTSLKFRIFRSTTSGSAEYWNETSQAWQSAVTGVTAAGGSDRNFTILRNGTDYKIIFGNLVSTLMETDWFSSYDIRDGGFDDTIIFGDPSNNAVNMDMILRNVSIGWNTTTWKNYSYQDNPFLFPVDEGVHSGLNRWWYSIYHINTTNNQYGIASLYSYKVAALDDRSIHIYNMTSNAVASNSVASHDIVEGTDDRWNLSYNTTDQWVGNGDFDYNQIFVSGTTSLNVNVSSQRPPTIANGSSAGYIDMGTGGTSAYYSLTNLTVLNGSICFAAVCETITGGSAWYERQWGSWDLSAYDGWDWIMAQANGKELLLFNLYDENGTDSRVTPYYEVMYGTDSTDSYGNYSTNSSEEGYSIDVPDYVYGNGIIKSHGFNISIPAENATIYMRARNLLAYNQEEPYTLSGTWNGEQLSGYSWGETVHEWNAIRRSNFSVSSTLNMTADIPVNYTNDNNIYLLNGTNATWINQIYADKNNITLHGVLNGVSRVDKVNLTIIPDSDYINVTLSSINSTVLSFTASNSSDGQTMDVTAYNDVLTIINGNSYQITKDGIMQGNYSIASGNSVVFTGIDVGSDYEIKDYAPELGDIDYVVYNQNTVYGMNNTNNTIYKTILLNSISELLQESDKIYLTAKNYLYSLNLTSGEINYKVMLSSNVNHINLSDQVRISTDRNMYLINKTTGTIEKKFFLNNISFP